MLTVNDTYNYNARNSRQASTARTWYERYREKPDVSYALQHGIDDWTRFYEEYFLYYLINCNLGRDSSSLYASTSIKRMGCTWEREQLVSSLRAKNRYPNSDYLNRVKRIMRENGLDNWVDVCPLLQA